jgi:hypothetical protein
MYINFNLLERVGIKWRDNELLVLQCLKQKDYDVLDVHSRDALNSLYKKGFVTLVKGNQPAIQRARVSKKGNKFLKDLSVAEITEESKQLAGNLISLYENAGKPVQNKKKIVELTAWFLAETDFSAEEIYNVVEEYIRTEEIKYVSHLQNLIWKGESVFSTNWNLAQSKLYGLLTK